MIAYRGDCDNCHMQATLYKRIEEPNAVAMYCRKCFDNPNWREERSARFWAIFWNKFGIQTKTYRELVADEL